MDLSTDAVARALTMQCKPLKVGEKRVLDIEEADSPTEVEHKYLLQRKGEKDYRISLNLEFRDGNDRAVTSAYQKKVEACLPLINSRLLGPEGEKLKIELYKQGTEANPPPKVVIQTGGSHRATSREYNPNPNCGTIAHELMHLLGLVDEYPEQVHNYSCRSIGPIHSLMYDSVSALNHALPGVYSCDCQTPECRALLQKGYKENSCPSGSKEGMPLWHPAIFGKKSLEEYQGILKNHPLIEKVITQGSQSVGSRYYYAEKPSMNSLLLPAQFHVIVNPGCPRNYPYYNRSLDAYRGSKETGGNGCIFPLSAEQTKDFGWLMQ